MEGIYITELVRIIMYVLHVKYNHIRAYAARCWISDEVGLLWSFIVTLIVFVLVWN